MPYTAKQRRMFNARATSEPKMAGLAREANAMARAGMERPPTRSEEPGRRHAMQSDMPAWMGMMPQGATKGPRRTPRKAK